MSLFLALCIFTGGIACHTAYSEMKKALKED